MIKNFIESNRKVINLAVFLILIVSMYLLLIENLSISKIPKLKLRDAFFKIARLDIIKTLRPIPLEMSDIALISIDESSYQHLNKKWPWGRDVFADFLYRLKNYQPRIIAMDFAFFGSTPNNEAADPEFAKAIKDSGNVLLACAYGKQMIYIEPEKMFRDNAMGYGLTGAVRDADNVIRKIRPFALILSRDKSADFSFELKASAFYLGIPHKNIIHHTSEIILKFPKDPRLEERAVTIPLDEEGSMNINYFQKFDDMNFLPFWKVYNGEIPKNALKDKLVIVSQTGELFHDQHLSPYGLQPGGAIIANAVATILSQNFIRELSIKFYYYILIFVCIVMSIVNYRLSAIRGFLFTFLSIILFFSASILFFINNIIFDIFDIVVLSILIYVAISFYKYVWLLVESADVRKLAITDSLTGLSTHRYFRFLVKNEIEKIFRKKNPIATLMIISIDQLRDINNKYGFEFGDRLIQTVATNLKDVFKPNRAVLTNLGGGELAVYLPKTSTGEAIGVAESARNMVASHKFKLPKDEIIISVTFGIAGFDKVYCPTADDLIICAKVALKRIKGLEGDHISVFNPKIDKFNKADYYLPKNVKSDLTDLGFLARDLEERNVELEELIRSLSDTKVELESAHFDTLRSLVIALEEKDPYTAGHSERVCNYTIKLAEKAGFPREEMSILKEAALLHDLGKIGIPQNILNKESKLEDYERDVLKTHPLFTVRILSTSKYFSKHLPIILHHHERYDGSGYPHMLSGDMIPMGAQIISIADTFDAMTTGRPYKKIAATKEEVVREFKKFSGTQFNPNLVKLFLEILEEDHFKAGDSK